MNHLLIFVSLRFCYQQSATLVPRRTAGRLPKKQCPLDVPMFLLPSLVFATWRDTNRDPFRCRNCWRSLKTHRTFTSRWNGSFHHGFHSCRASVRAILTKCSSAAVMFVLIRRWLDSTTLRGSVAIELICSREATRKLISMRSITTQRSIQWKWWKTSMLRCLRTVFRRQKTPFSFASRRPSSATRLTLIRSASSATSPDGSRGRTRRTNQSTAMSVEFTTPLTLSLSRERVPNISAIIKIGRRIRERHCNTFWEWQKMILTIHPGM